MNGGLVNLYASSGRVHAAVSLGARESPELELAAIHPGRDADRCAASGALLLSPAGALRSTPGKAIVSVNDVLAMRDAFAGLPAKKVAIKYSVGGAGRADRSSGELIIRNWR